MNRLLLAIACFTVCGNMIADDHTQYVNPFIGTQTDASGALSGSTFPGACVPYGNIQLCPETEYYVTWDPCCGYDYNKNRIYGITHNHLSGTGCTDLIDVSLMPSVATMTPEYVSGEDYSQSFSHEEEGAEPGYYWVNLKESGVKVELSATVHAGIHKYTFPKGTEQNVVFDLAKMVYDDDDAYYAKSNSRRYKILQSQLRIVDDHTVEGYRIITGWAKVRRVYFHAEFSKPFKSHMLMDGKRNVWNGTTVNGKKLRAALCFDNAGQELLAKVSISAVDMEGARKNFNAECQSWDFNAYRQAAHDVWQKQLAKIDVNGTATEKTIFYTGLYHTMIQPNEMSDVDGRYVTTNYEIKQLPKGEKYYSTFSLWDTFRAAHPLYNLLDPEITAQFVNSMLLHQQEYGYLPIWDLWGQDNYCMIGNHAMPVLSRAILTGIPGIDVEKAYKAMYESSTLSHQNSPFEVWEKYGYMPETKQVESVSITLEQAFDDWCVYAIAKKLGKTDDAERFLKRSEYYRNLWDKSIGFFAPKDENGNFIRPFSPLAYGKNGGYPFAEGNAWQYMWFVPQNPQGLIELLGGEKAFIKKLNENFTLEDKSADQNENASGFIGQYAHGNEPSHHTVYLYNFAHQPWRTQELVNEVRQKFYNDKPYGYAGNDDCGQMSAWYIFSSMGFYPFNAGSDEFVIGTPLFTETVIHLPNGKTLTIKAPRKSDKAIYVKSVKLNGRELRDLKFTQQDIMEGGVLEFKMSTRK
jgi:predicted alpha-1,2-mannosidase